MHSLFCLLPGSLVTDHTGISTNELLGGELKFGWTTKISNAPPPSPAINNLMEN